MQRALRANVAITTSSTLWFAEYPEAKTICVTGTKGKSTTSALLAHALEHLGFKVQLAGNIGRALLDCEADDIDWWVIELSSYQLADLEARPSLGVLLNLSSEHLDWHGSERRYMDDKLRLVELMQDGPLVANADDDVLTSKLSNRPDTHWFDHEESLTVARDVTLPKSLPGAHNLANVAAALTAIEVLGFDVRAAAESFSSFKSLPHRLQVLGEKHGLVFINDSISSTPLSTVAALQALSGHWITLIVGGLDRGLDWTMHFEKMRSVSPGAVIGIPDNGQRILSGMAQFGLKPEKGLHGEQDLAAAVQKALELTPSGGYVLLSPGAPSFPQFRDFVDRGNQFAQLCGFDLSESTPSQEADERRPRVQG